MDILIIFFSLCEASLEDQVNPQTETVYFIGISFVTSLFSQNNPMKHRLGFFGMGYSSERLSNLEKFGSLGSERA